MPRLPVVSRTIATSVCEILKVDTTTSTSTWEKVTIPKLFKSEQKVLDYIKRKYDTDVTKHVSIKNLKQRVSKYEMPIETFIKYAKITIK